MQLASFYLFARFLPILMVWERLLHLSGTLSDEVHGLLRDLSSSKLSWHQA